MSSHPLLRPSADRLVEELADYSLASMKLIIAGATGLFATKVR